MRAKYKVISRCRVILGVLGLTLAILGLVVAITFLILSILYIRGHSPEVPANFVMGFMVGQIFFNMGIMFYLGYIHAKLE